MSQQSSRSLSAEPCSPLPRAAVVAVVSRLMELEGGEGPMSQVLGIARAECGPVSDRYILQKLQHADQLLPSGEPIQLSAERSTIATHVNVQFQAGRDLDGAHGAASKVTAEPAKEEGVAIKLEDGSQVVDNGVCIKREKSKEAISVMLKDIPEFGNDGVRVKREPGKENIPYHMTFIGGHGGYGFYSHTSLSRVTTRKRAAESGYDNKNGNTAVGSAGHGNNSPDHPPKRSKTSPDAENSIECDCCSAPTSGEESIVLGCNHRFCAECLNEIVCDAINDDESFPAICGLDGDEIDVEDNVHIQQLLSRELVSRYVRRAAILRTSR